MNEKEFNKIIDKALKIEKTFPKKSREYMDDENVDAVQSLIGALGLDISFDKWFQEDNFCMFWSKKIGYTIILDSDVRLEWSNYIELKKELWAYVEQGQKLENSITIKK